MIQLFQGKHILKALMIGEYIYMDTIQVVSQYIECKHHCWKLEVMSWKVLLMRLKLPRGLSYHLTLLHQHTTYANFGCITIDNITI